LEAPQDMSMYLKIKLKLEPLHLKRVHTEALTRGRSSMTTQSFKIKKQFMLVILQLEILLEQSSIMNKETAQRKSYLQLNDSSK
jgi:hypothetical protein